MGTVIKGKRRITAAVLSVAMVFVFAGCDIFGVRQSMGAMFDRLANFNKALNELDFEAAKEYTNWTGEDEDYKEAEALFDTSDLGDKAGEGFVSCTEYIASTIVMKYDVTSAHIDDNQASLDVTFEMVDWRSVYNDPHDSFEEVLEDLKACEDRITVEAVVVFENVDGQKDWRISEINDIDEVMSFVYTIPDITDQND